MSRVEKGGKRSLVKSRKDRGNRSKRQTQHRRQHTEKPTHLNLNTPFFYRISLKYLLTWNRRQPEYYQNLIERHDTAKAPIKHRYDDATKDNLSGIRGKFIR